MNSRYLINNLTLIWAMDCGTGQVLGFTTEATNLITALHSAIRIKIHVNNEDECRNELKKAGFPVSVRKLMHLLMVRFTNILLHELLNTKSCIIKYI